MGFPFCLSIIVLLVGYSHGQVNCPYRGAYVAHPTNCKAYYTCDYQPVYMECGEQLVFNPQHNVCDWPGNVPGCENYYTSGGNTNTGGGSIVCPASGSHYYADPQNCHMYYRCENGKLYHFECGFNLGWDDSRKGCYPPEEVASCNTQPTTPAPVPTTPVPTTIPSYVNCTISEFHADLDDCTKYYRCFGGEVFHIECPSGFIFDLVNENCGEPANIPLASVFCNEETTPPAPTTTTEPVTVCYLASTPAPVCSSVPPILGQEVTTVTPETICVEVNSPVRRQAEDDVTDFKCLKNGRFRNDRQADDTSYISCHNDTAKIRRCRHGKIFNPSLGRCARIALSE